MNIRNDKSIKLHESRLPKEAKEYIRAFRQTLIIIATLFAAFYVVQPDSELVEFLYKKIGTVEGFTYDAVGIVCCLVVCIAIAKPGVIRAFFRKQASRILRTMVQSFYKCSSAFIIGGISTAITTSLHASKDWFLCAAMAVIIGYMFSVEVQRSTGNIMRKVKVKAL